MDFKDVAIGVGLGGVNAALGGEQNRRAQQRKSNEALAMQGVKADENIRRQEIMSNRDQILETIKQSGGVQREKIKQSGKAEKFYDESGFLLNPEQVAQRQASGQQVFSGGLKNPANTARSGGGGGSGGLSQTQVMKMENDHHKAYSDYVQKFNDDPLSDGTPDSDEEWTKGNRSSVEYEHFFGGESVSGSGGGPGEVSAGSAVTDFFSGKPGGRNENKGGTFKKGQANQASKTASQAENVIDMPMSVDEFASETTQQPAPISMGDDNSIERLPVAKEKNKLVEMLMGSYNIFEVIGKGAGATAKGITNKEKTETSKAINNKAVEEIKIAAIEAAKIHDWAEDVTQAILKSVAGGSIKAIRKAYDIMTDETIDVRKAYGLPPLPRDRNKQ